MTRGRERSHITPRKVASQRHMLRPFPQCARAARACSRHTCKHAFVTARLGGEHICVSTKTAIDAILRVHARDMHMSKVCIRHYTLEREALVVRKVYMWVVTVCASARVLREPLRGPYVPFRTAVALNEFKALCRELV